MTKPAKAFPAAAAMFLLFATVSLARADVSNDLAVVTTGAGGITPAITFSTKVHGTVERQEMNVTSPVALQIVALLDCTAKTYNEMNPSLKIFTSMPLAQSPADEMSLPNFETMFDAAGRTTAIKSGTITTNVTVKDLGMDTPPGLTKLAHHYALDSHHISTGAAGVQDQSAHTDIWLDPTLQRPACPERIANPRTWTTPGGATIVSTITGDVAAYEAMQAYLPVELQLKPQSGGGLTFRQTVSSTDPQDASLFTVPADYKQVTYAEFVTDTENGILDQIAGPQPKLPGSTPAQPKTPGTT